MPKEFNRKVYLEIAHKQDIPDKTAQRYIREICKSGELHHDGHDRYKNVFSRRRGSEEVEDEQVEMEWKKPGDGSAWTFFEVVEL